MDTKKINPKYCNNSLSREYIKILICDYKYTMDYTIFKYVYIFTKSLKYNSYLMYILNNSILD